MPSGTWGYLYVEDGKVLGQPVGLAAEQGRRVKPTETFGPGKDFRTGPCSWGPTCG